MGAFWVRRLKIAPLNVGNCIAWHARVLWIAGEKPNQPKQQTPKTTTGKTQTKPRRWGSPSLALCLGHLAEVLKISPEVYVLHLC